MSEEEKPKKKFWWEIEREKCREQIAQKNAFIEKLMKRIDELNIELGKCK